MSETTTFPVDPGEEEHAPVEIADKPREPTPYEVRLRREAANARAKLRAAEAERDAAKQGVTAAEAKAAQDIEAARAEANSAAEQRIIRAEIKASALAAGMIDLDGLKLLDLSGVKLDDKGDVKLPDGFFDKARQAKPYLFKAEATTSAAKEPPPAAAPAAKRASDMTPAEIRAWKQSQGIRA